VVDEVHRLLDEERLDDVVMQVHELGDTDVLDVRERPGLEVVHADHTVTAAQQLVAQMRPQEARAPGDKARRHEAARITPAS
jgi:hypothetical protein